MDASSFQYHAHVLPTQEQLQHAQSHLITSLPKKGLGFDQIKIHMQEDLVPGFNKQGQSPYYYGFVTGGATPAALLGDQIATENDQNLHTHLPNETMATTVEDGALTMLCELLELEPDEWPHRTFSTGATASNVLGLACGRDFVLRKLSKSASVADCGIYEAMRTAGVESVQVLTTVPHSSLRKAASIVGLGRSCFIDVGQAGSPHKFDMSALESALRKSKTASIVAVSCGEVNTGLFATNGAEMKEIRRLCDQQGAWLHVDAAFGLLARTLPDTDEYSTIVQGVKGLELADSITGDAHKLLNVPYDCGIFLSHHLELGISVFQNTNAAYLSTAATNGTAGSTHRTIPSPLNLGIENSRRFRALPVYATLTAYGREGYRDMMERQIRLSRAIAQFISECDDYELLPSGMRVEDVYIIVLFRAKDEKINEQLVKRIQATREIYVSGTVWGDRPAARFAVANWLVNVERDTEVIRGVLEKVAKR